MRGFIWIGVICGYTFAQEAHFSHRPAPVPHTLLERPTTLRQNIGSAHDSVSTTAKEAQSYYDQGLAYLHSFVWIEAARSFNQALRSDPNLGVAYAGLSYAFVEVNDSAAARAAMERAVALGGKASDHDRRHIEARAAQMAAESAPHDTARLSAYRKVLDEALAQFPNDEEFWLQRGIAESSDPADRGQGSPASAARYYDQALKLAPEHFAAHHLLVHMYENSGRINEALQHARSYASMAPSIPHAVHMYGHELRRVGRTDDAVAQFETADRLENEYFKAEKIPAEFDWHYQHNLDLLGVSYQYLGQYQKAEQRFIASFMIPSALAVEEFNKREWPAFLLARGRNDETLAAAKQMIEHISPLIRATGHIYAGRAYLALHQFQNATTESNAALHELNSATDGAALVAPELQHLQGEFFLRTGQKDKGQVALNEFIRKLRVAGPDEWTQALFALEAIARAARESGDWELAGRVAAQMLEHDTAYAGTHYAIALVADHAGDREKAKTEFRLAQKFWSKADPNIPELRDIQAHLNQ